MNDSEIQTFEKLFRRLREEDPAKVDRALEQLKAGLPRISMQEPDMDREVLAALIEVWSSWKLKKARSKRWRPTKVAGR